MQSKEYIRSVTEKFLFHRLGSQPGVLHHLTKPESLEPFVYVAYEKIQELEKNNWFHHSNEIDRYIQDQAERWGNSKLDGLLTKILKSKSDI